MSAGNQTGSLNTVAALAATSGALHQTLLGLAACHGGRSGKWLDDLEASVIRDTKNMIFSGTNMDAEAAAVQAALTNVKLVFDSVRRKLQPPTRGTITVTINRHTEVPHHQPPT